MWGGFFLTTTTIIYLFIYLANGKTFFSHNFHCSLFQFSFTLAKCISPLSNGPVPLHSPPNKDHLVTKIWQWSSYHFILLLFCCFTGIIRIVLWGCLWIIIHNFPFVLCSLCLRPLARAEANGCNWIQNHGKMLCLILFCSTAGRKGSGFSGGAKLVNGRWGLRNSARWDN